MPEHYEMKLQKGDGALARNHGRRVRASLCDDDGTLIEIDAEVLDVGKVYLRVKIMRMMRLTRLTAPQEMAVTRFVQPNNVLDVLDHSPSIWPNAAL